MTAAVPELLTPVEAAKVLKVAVQTLAHGRVKGTGPVFIKLDGGRVRYDAADLAAWIAARKRASTAEAV